jgi:hypothetical protein
MPGTHDLNGIWAIELVDPIAGDKKLCHPPRMIFMNGVAIDDPEK